MNEMYKRIEDLCSKRGVTITAMCREADVTRGNLTDLKMGRQKSLSPKNLDRIARYFGVSMDYLLNPDSALPSGIIPMPKMRQIPLIGTISCGTPILAQENIEDHVDIPEHISADFALRCKGDSMINARIFDGDIVYIRQQDTVENGEIAAVLIDDAATLKRVRLYGDHISLEPENPQHKPLVLWGEEMNTVRILGKAVAFTSTLF